MREVLVALPIALPVVAAAACLVAWRHPHTQRAIVIAALLCLLGVAAALLATVARSGPVTLSVGGWAAPIGVEFRADLTAAIMTLVAAVIGSVVALYAVADVPWDQQRRGFWPLFVLLLMGVCGAFLTADLFNLFVWFEVLLIASFALLALGTTRSQLAGAHVYVILSLLGSMLFLVGVGLVYAAVRTLDLAQISERMGVLSETRPGTTLAIQATLLVAFGLKAAVFPLMFWLPPSYHTPPPAVSALFAALLTKVGVYALIRVTAGVFPTSAGVQVVLVGVAIATMIVGVLGALAQQELRQIFSFHIVSQIGYMVAGLAVADAAPPARRFAIAAALFYVVHHILVKANLFLIAGIVRHLRRTESLRELGGMARAHPWLAGLFLISALSLAGVPPLSGFWAKLAIVGAALERDRIAVVVVAVVVGLLTLTSMLKIWLGVFAGEPVHLDARPLRRDLIAMYAASAALAALTLVLSLWPGTLFELALRAADQLAPPAHGPLWSGSIP